MPPLKPETKVAFSLVQTCIIVSAIVVATWHTTLEFAEIKAAQHRIEAFIKDEAVTQQQATAYASAFRWENRSENLVVPEPKNYRN